jgi:hypothetical protein
MPNPFDTASLTHRAVDIHVAFAHPQYDEARDDWRMIRDCIAGEKHIKRRGTYYLPRLEDMSQNEYRDYVDRATFFNMVGRTLNGMVGTVFRRQPRVLNLPTDLEENSQKIGKDLSPLHLVIKDLVTEVLTTGRAGVLLDMAPEPNTTPYLATYIAENIIDWDVIEIEGRWEMASVLLRELVLDRDEMMSTGRRQYKANYRKLVLEPDFEFGSPWVYRQYVWSDHSANMAPDFNAGPDYVFTPVNRGVPFDRIPFRFFGPSSNGMGIEKSPLLDIANLNISHYRTYAHLEHGRFYTGLPVYYAQVSDGQQSPEYRVGPGVVWEVPPGNTPGILEFNGHGLKSLENALDFKEQHVSALGGRILGVRGTAVSESDNQVKFKERNEQSILLNVTDAATKGLTDLLRLWAMWQDASEAQVSQIKVEINQDFLFDNISAREFRAVHAMYMDGVLPIEVLYDYFRRAELIPDWMPMQMLEKKLADPSSFPSQPDAEARKRGYPDRQAELEEKARNQDRRLQSEMQAQAQAASEVDAPDGAQGDQGGDGNA